MTSTPSHTWCGIGEIMSRHDDLTTLTYGEPPHIDHPAFLDIFDLGPDEGLPVLIHHNITAQNNEEVPYRDPLLDKLKPETAEKICKTTILGLVKTYDA